MSGSKIVPDEIPGQDVFPESIATAAASFRTTATSIGDSSDAVVTDWSGLAVYYTAPEAPQLLSSMDPVATDSHTIAERLTSVAGFLDTLAENVAAPIKRLKELKIEAQEFVDSVAGGVTIDYYDPDNTLMQANAMDGAPVFIPDGYGEQTIPWSEHTPSVTRNNELLEQVNAEIAKVMAARADCVNGINGLREDVCIAPEVAPTAEQLDASTDLDWGTQGNGDRSCGESIGDGIYDFGEGIVTGVGALVGIDMSDGFDWSLEYAGQAWGGLLQGVGALAITGVAPWMPALTHLPDEWVPEPLKGARDWYNTQTDAIVGSIIGTPEQWEEDPVAAGTYAVLSVGTFFIPVAGQVGAGVKVASALGKAGIAAERLAQIAKAGKLTSNLANGLTRTSEVFTRLGETVKVLNGGGDLARSLDKTVDGLEALDDMPDIVPDNLGSKSDTTPDVTPGEKADADANGTDSTPSDSTPSDTTPGDSTPGDSTPGDSTPGDSTPGDSGGDTTPAAREYLENGGDAQAFEKFADDVRSGEHDLTKAEVQKLADDPNVKAAVAANDAVARRVTLRAGVKMEIFEDAVRTTTDDFRTPTEPVPIRRYADGEPILFDDAGHQLPKSATDGTSIPVKGSFDFGHGPAFQWKDTRIEATLEGWTRKQVIDYENTASHYRVETQAGNRSNLYNDVEVK